MGPDGSANPKIREARLRRSARRRGLVLKKSKRRDPSAIDYGRYVLLPPGEDGGNAFASGSGVSLDTIEQQLAS